MRKIRCPAARHSLNGGWASARRPAAARLSAGIGSALTCPGGDPGASAMPRELLVCTAEGRASLGRSPHTAYRLLLVLRGPARSLQLLNIGRSQYWFIDRDGHLVDRASKFERHLVVGVIHRGGAGATDV